MNLTTKIILIVAIAILAMLIIATQFKKLQAKSSLAEKEEELKQVYKIFPLEKGDNLDEVKIVQKWLNKKSGPPLQQLSIDGDFGNKTQDMLLAHTNKKSVSYGEYINMKQEL